MEILMKAHRLSINTILLAVIGALLVLIIAVSAIALCTKNARPGEGLRREDPLPSSIKKSGSVVFNNIGQIRVFTRETDTDEKSVLVLTPWFEADSADNSLYEELDRKRMSLKALITHYFSSYTKAELLSKGESSIKSELKKSINDTLVLGSISALYFNDYLFLD